MSICLGFTCRLKSSCLYGDNYCDDLVNCRFVRAADEIQRCKMCYLVNSCAYAKELMKNGKHN